MYKEWSVVPLRELVERVITKNDRDIDRVLTVSAVHGLVMQESFFTKRVASKNLEMYFVVEPGDYVYNKSYSNGYPIGVVRRNIDSVPGVVSPLYIVLRLKPNICIDGWLDLAFESRVYAESLQGSLKEGGRAHGLLNIKLDDYFSALIPVPPLSAQHRIVDLMAHLDGHLENVRAERDAADQLLIALRNNLLAPTSDWTESTLGELTTKIGSGATPRGGESAYVQAGISLIRSQNVYDFRFQWEGLARITDSQARLLNGVTVESGDVLINITGASVNRVCCVPDSVLPARVNQHVAILRPDKSKLDSSFLAHLLRRSDLKMRLNLLSGSGTTRQAITKIQLEAFIVALPNISEQRRLTSVLVEQVHLIDRISKEAEALEAFRSTVLKALLAGAVSLEANYDILIPEVA